MSFAVGDRVRMGRDGDWHQANPPFVEGEAVEDPRDHLLGVVRRCFWNGGDDAAEPIGWWLDIAFHDGTFTLGPAKRYWHVNVVEALARIRT